MIDMTSRRMSYSIIILKGTLLCYPTIKLRPKPRLRFPETGAMPSEFGSSVQSHGFAFKHLFGVFLTGVIVYGVSAAFATLIRTKHTNFDILFSGFQNFGTTCVAGILQGIYIFLWSLLFLIPGIVKSYSYAMT